MSTVQEIEAAIEQLPPKDFLALQDWMAKRAVPAPGRPWTPEALSEAARQAVNEPDSAKAQALWERTVAGFYGDANA